MAPRGPDEAYCRDCGDPIMWRDTTAGKRIALDASCDPAGVVRLVGGRAETLGPHDAAERRAAGELLFKPHVVSCPAKRARGGVGMPPEIRERIRRRQDPAERIRIEMAKRGSRRRGLGGRE
ncbi:hypothetical protein [Corynebacterium sp. HMSC11E11]|uniref:hypothetical protein n=1 Tax=Corynebacterium sp. HMSC11E11 TaxID=1581089 RepID=UPI0008A37C45|nr:hypothetical protein [Corynebacterium sp. HMSC11E11]OFU55764.1 hypothetical protein HMPREF3121_05485 [Corynebacterium sp. HMSC11E11]